MRIWNEWNDFMLCSRIVPPADGCHEEANVTHARLPKGVPKLEVGQRTLTASNAPLQILDWVFRNEIVIHALHIYLPTLEQKAQSLKQLPPTPSTRRYQVCDYSFLIQCKYLVTWCHETTFPISGTTGERTQI